jgi:hypothetical protein
MAKARPVTPAPARSLRRSRLLGAAAVGVPLAACLGAGIGITAATAGTATHGGTAGQAPHRCTTSACVSAAKSARAAAFPPANPVLPPRSRWMTQAAALAAARGDAQAADGKRLASALAGRLTAKAAEMTIDKFDVGQHIGDDADIAPSRLVWGVTVHADMAEDAPPGQRPVVKHFYTDVYDVATGTLILQGIGVAAVR